MGLIKRMMKKKNTDISKYVLIKKGKRYITVTRTSRHQKRASEVIKRVEQKKKQDKKPGRRRKYARYFGQSGAKINRAALNGRIGLFNPGGIISEYFRNLAIERNLGE